MQDIGIDIPAVRLGLWAGVFSINIVRGGQTEEGAAPEGNPQLEGLGRSPSRTRDVQGSASKKLQSPGEHKELKKTPCKIPKG